MATSPRMLASRYRPVDHLLASPSRLALSSRDSRTGSRLKPFWPSQRRLSTSEGENAPFDRSAKLRQRVRSARNAKSYYEARTLQNDDSNPPRIPYDYFHAEVANRLVDRLDDILTPDSRGFPLALEVGSGGGNFVHEAICAGYDDSLELDSSETSSQGGRGGVRKLVQLDSCYEMLHRDDAVRSNANDGLCETYKLVADEEGHPWSFPEGTFDLVISSMAFHWVNDLPKLLLEIKRVLKPDGCLLFALPGGNTLPELRSSLVLSELERTGGVSAHLGPFIDASNVGGLLTGTGFRLPTVDVDEISIGYPNMMVLMEHLSRMGEGNACKARRERVGLGTFLGAAAVYRELYPEEEEEEGIVASAQVIYGIAWKEHESQQKALERGSATNRMTEIAVTKTTTNRDG